MSETRTSVPRAPGDNDRIRLFPVNALPVAGAAVAFLVFAIAKDWLWALNFCHVAGGALWTGIDLFVGFVVGPVSRRMSAQARVEFARRFLPNMLLLMPTLVTMTLASGFQLARHLGFLNDAYPYHSWIVASFVIVGVMAITTLGVLLPANIAVLFEFRRDRLRPDVIAALIARVVTAYRIIGVMQIGTLIVMTRIAA